jgi:hypothetical protein
MRRKISFRILVGAAGLFCLLGCGVKAAHEAERYESPAAVPADAIAGLSLSAEGSDTAAPRFAEGAKQGVAPGSGAASTASGVDRKIIYTANVELAVESFSGMPDRVIALVKQYDAYVAGSSLSGSTGENRRGTWTIRVPVARFDEFVNASKGLGELVNVSTGSRDVSEEYYDVDARIRNKTKEEERLLKLLEERPGKLEDVIAIERELSRVREELERMQGRMRVLADLTSLTTVELSIVEIRDYEPPQAPTLATRIRRTFGESLATLQTAGETMLLAAVGTAPWVPVAVVIAAPLFVFARRHRQATRTSREQDVTPKS